MGGDKGRQCTVSTKGFTSACGAWHRRHSWRAGSMTFFPFTVVQWDFGMATGFPFSLGAPFSSRRHGTACRGCPFVECGTHPRRAESSRGRRISCRGRARAHFKGGGFRGFLVLRENPNRKRWVFTTVRQRTDVRQ